MSVDREASKRTSEEKVQLNQYARAWLLNFFSVIRTAQFHESGNQIFKEPIHLLIRNGNSILDLDGKIDIRILEDQFFVNGLWIKPKLSERDNFFSLVSHLVKRKLGGIIQSGSMSDWSWNEFIHCYKNLNTTDDAPHAELNQMLAKRNVEQLEFRKVSVLLEQEDIHRPLPATAYEGVKNYAKLLYSFKEFSETASEDDRIAVFRKAQRSICNLVDIAEAHPRLALGLTLMKNLDSYYLHHGVNVLILSTALGQKLGFSRRQLVDLGMAALFHDIGKLKIPKKILDRPGPLSDSEWEIIRQHPTESAMEFLTLGYLSQTLGERALVAFQHHWASAAPDTYPIPRRKMRPSLFSSIVAITVAFDALTTLKPYRKPFAPHESLRVLWTANRSGAFHGRLLKSFSQLLGPIPFGSWVKLPSGICGLVASSGSLSPSPPYPLVYVPDGHQQGIWVDVAEEIKKSGKAYRIHPVEFSFRDYQRALSGVFRFGLDQIY